MAVQQVVNHVSGHLATHRFLVGLMNHTGFYDLSGFAEALKPKEKGLFLLPAHVAVLMMMTHTYYGFYAFFLIPAYDPVYACFM